MASPKDRITCHVLDTSTGQPARSLRVRLELAVSQPAHHGQATKTFESHTDDDGRIAVWLPYSSALSAGEVPVYTLDDVLGTVEAEQSKKDEDKKQGSNANVPRRGLSAFMFFANEQREKVREDNPGIYFGQVGKILAERWKALDEKQREAYEAKAQADKQRYEDEKAAYNPSSSYLDDVEEKKEGSSKWTLRFDTEEYFGDGAKTFFPEVAVTFRVESGQRYHVPLLLSPFGYTTYRGS